MKVQTNIRIDPDLLEKLKCVEQDRTMTDRLTEAIRLYCDIHSCIRQKPIKPLTASQLEKARKARAKYMRQWKKSNPELVKAQKQRYWLRKYEQDHKEKR